MRTYYYIGIFLLSLLQLAKGQSTNPAPYCVGSYGSGACMQGSNNSNSTQNGVNDFIDFFRTSGGNVNITNDSSGCNMNPNNYAMYCNHYIAAQQGQTITCTMKSGITFAQGFAIFIDWNQDGTFQVPLERVAATNNVPPPATWITLTFTIPSNAAPGIYRMRVRCAFATAGTQITPCGQFSFGETEDYSIVVGNVPQNCSVVTATASVNSPVCAATSLSFNVNSNCTGLSYLWTGPGNFSTTSQNPVRFNSNPLMSGIYTVVVSNSVCPVTRTVDVRVVAYPVFTISPLTPTVCQGGKFYASTTFSLGTNINQFNFNWGPTPGFGIFSQYAPQTSITPVPLSPSVQMASTIYSVIVTPTALATCSVVGSLTATVNNPLTPQINTVSPLCNNSGTVQLVATPGGGTWSASPFVSPGGILNTALVNTFVPHSVAYAVNMGTCLVSNTGTFMVYKYNTPALTSTLTNVCSLDAPKNLMIHVQNTNGAWSGQNVSANFFNMTIPNVLNTGAYTLKYKTHETPVTNLNVCPDSVFMTVQVFNPPTPTISAISPKCTNEASVQLSAIPGGGTWSNATGITVSGVQIPSLCIPGDKTVTYTAGQGTCVASSSAPFHVSAFRTAALTTPLSDQCSKGGPVNLLSIVQNTLGTWSGINVSANTFTPTNLPTNNYTLTYLNESAPNKVGSSRVDLQACKLEYSIVSPK